MKPSKPSKKKPLPLAAQTVRPLAGAQLAAVVGGVLVVSANTCFDGGGGIGSHH